MVQLQDYNCAIDETDFEFTDHQPCGCYVQLQNITQHVWNLPFTYPIYYTKKYYLFFYNPSNLHSHPIDGDGTETN